MPAFAQILVPVDYSAPSDAALRMAADLARAFKGRLLVLHLLPLEVYRLGDFPIVAGDGMHLAEETERLAAHVREILGDRDAPAHEVEVSWGSPYLQIVETAIDRRADLIVMGTHGRTGLKHALLGSVAEKTVRLAPCPVLTVREWPASGAPLQEIERGPARPASSGPGAVGRVMTANPKTVGPGDVLESARALMAEARVRHLPVVEHGRLVGILSDRDLPAHVGQLARTRVHVAMTGDPVTVSPDVSVEAAARLMLERRVRALPVVDGERVIGILSVTDILEDYVRAARG
jgi:CBS domain-containing protein/nucleotide-binding universal stress UspA family protein